MSDLKFDFLFDLRRHLTGYSKLGIFTMQPFAFWSFGSFTTVTNNSFPSSPKATLVVPSPAAISKTCRSLPSGDSSIVRRLAHRVEQRRLRRLASIRSE